MNFVEQWEMRIQRKARLEKCFVCCLFVYVLLFCLLRILLYGLKFSYMLLFLLKLSWPKTLVKKWFNMKNKAEDFVSDDIAYRGDCSLCLFKLQNNLDMSIGFPVLVNPNETGVFSFPVACSEAELNSSSKALMINLHSSASRHCFVWYTSSFWTLTGCSV